MTPSRAPAPVVETRRNLLDAAERLFARHGVDAASLRTITREAGANLAAVHYHFGSKDALVRAVFARRLAPMNEERLKLLDAAEADRDPPDLEAVIRAFVEPVLRMGRDLSESPEDASIREFPRLLSRAFAEPAGRDVVLDELREVKERFVGAFHRILPDLSHEDLYWRFHFMVGAMSHVTGARHVIEQTSEGACDVSDPENILDRLVTFLEAGWRCA